MASSTETTGLDFAEMDKISDDLENFEFNATTTNATWRPDGRDDVVLFLLIVYPIVFLIGVFGNTLVITIVLKYITLVVIIVIIITNLLLPRPGGYVIPGVCLSDCLFVYTCMCVCWQLHKNTDRIFFIKFYQKLYLWTWKVPSDFGRLSPLEKLSLGRNARKK